jgi:hypothetical protein
MNSGQQAKNPPRLERRASLSFQGWKKSSTFAASMFNKVMRSPAASN